jgi:Animal haem peroxidase
MKSSRRFRLQHVRSKHWAVVTVLALALSPTGAPYFVAQVHAQTQAAPVGNGFVINAEDLRFIYSQILVAQDHAAGGTLLGSGPNQVRDPQLPRGLRTVDGSFNNLVPVPDQHLFGAADRLFPRLTTPLFRDAEAGTSYKQKLLNNVVVDSQPRIITNLIADQSRNNPAAVAVATNPCGFGGFVCSPPAPDPLNPDPLASVTDPDSGALFIPNITPDFGLSAPFNLMFTFFGQFFDHGLDLVTKGGGTVMIPLQPDDPLFVAGGSTNFMVMTRGQNQPGPDGIIGTADDIQETINETTPWVDQNQTYTSHPSHQVFLREYRLDANGQPTATGGLLDHAGGGLPTWEDVKVQARSMLGIDLTDVTGGFSLAPTGSRNSSCRGRMEKPARRTMRSSKAIRRPRPARRARSARDMPSSTISPMTPYRPARSRMEISRSASPISTAPTRAATTTTNSSTGTMSRGTGAATKTSA